MDNLISVTEVMLRGTNTIIPCLRVLRGIDIASRQQGANFTAHISFSYQSAGTVVTTQEYSGLLKGSTFEEQMDPQWVEVMAPALDLRQTPDAGTAFTCKVYLTITDRSGEVVACGPADTQTVRATPA